MIEEKHMEESAYFRVLEEKYGCEIQLCGSKVTCEPVPTDTDTDYLCYLPKKEAFDHVVARLRVWGYTPEGDGHYQVTNGDTGFTSWRNGENINVILTADKDFYDKHKTATELCRRLNLLKKSDRVLVFQTILYGNVDFGNESKAA